MKFTLRNRFNAVLPFATWLLLITNSSAEPPTKSGQAKTATPAPIRSSSDNTAEPGGQSLDEMLLFHPWKYPRGTWNPPGLKHEDVSFAARDGTKLHGWYCPAVKPRAVVLFAHGNGGNLTLETSLLKILQNKRISVFIFDYRGYGRSEGTATVEGILQDARAARKQLATIAGVKETEIILMGRSMGGAVVSQLAAEVPPRGLIIESSFSSLQDVARHHYPKLAWLVPAEKLNSCDCLTRYAGPLLLSHGDADKVVPFTQGQKLYDAAKGPKEFLRLPRGDHNDSRTSDYFKRLDRFVSTL